jgi:hypothetical protein
MFSYGLFPGVLRLTANISEHPVCSIFIDEWVLGTSSLVHETLATNHFNYILLLSVRRIVYGLHMKQN